ncbi:MAG: hypothetical protein Aurels2KO_48470 [Aureliella sp.]
MDGAWEFTSGTARTNWDDWSAIVQPVDATRPTQLVGSGPASDAQRPWDIFSVEPQPKHALEIEEAYARGEDVIAQYAQAEGDSFCFHLYWRNLPKIDQEQCSLELWLGVQTGLLDSRPELHVTCCSEGDRWDKLMHSDLADGSNLVDDGINDSLAGYVCRRSDSVGLWLIEPSDQCHVSPVHTDSSGSAAVAIFDHFMEKGVIRRGRMRFHVFGSDASIEHFKAAYERFATSDLPLTA